MAILNLQPPILPTRRTSRHVAAPVLENGDHLNTHEFLRRYEFSTDVRKAQLIEGIVHMPSPVRADAHAAPHGLITFWLNYFAMLHPELAVYPNATLLLDAENAVQPDSILCTAPRAGRDVYLNAKGYLCGSPELVCEITASTASVDLHEKLRAYRRNGIQEYLVWLTEEKKVLWFELVDQAYITKTPKSGKLSSTIFLGLILDVKALLKMDRSKLVQGLAG